MKKLEKKIRSVYVRDKYNHIVHDEVIEITEDRFKSIKFRHTYYKGCDFINGEIENTKKPLFLKKYNLL